MRYKRDFFFVLFFSLALCVFSEKYKIMSFNIQYGNTKSTLNNETWLNDFRGILLETNPDILFIQEVGSSNNGITKLHEAAGISTYGMFSTEKYFAYKSYVNKGIIYSGYAAETQHNVVFYKKSKFTATDLASQLRFTSPEQTKYPSDFNNFQCIILSTSEGKNLIVVNAHVRPVGRDYWKMKKDCIHARDTITLRNLLYDLEQKYPYAAIIAGGDFNYSWRALTSEWSDNQKLSSEWKVDPGYKPETAKEHGLGTTYKDYPWDHFICNDLVNNPKKFSLALKITNEGTTYVNGRYIKHKDFNDHISDHWPIWMTFEY